MMIDYPMINLIGTGKRIREAVRESGYTTTEIMGYMGMRHTKSIYAWYRGDCLPTLENISALSVLLDIPINDLLVYD